jgi:hypothetical protein
VHQIKVNHAEFPWYVSMRCALHRGYKLVVVGHLSLRDAISPQAYFPTTRFAYVLRMRLLVSITVV